MTSLSTPLHDMYIVYSYVHICQLSLANGVRQTHVWGVGVLVVKQDTCLELHVCVGCTLISHKNGYSLHRLVAKVE